jgi:phosphoribosylamine--glycine ligase
MEVLVIGSGGREYELARQMSKSANVQRVYVAPGNGGTSVLEKTVNVDILPTDLKKLTEFVTSKKIGLTILGPDAAVAAGVANALRKEEFLVFGPTKEAGRLESSKSFAADFMERHNIPQPIAWVMHNKEEALQEISDKVPDSYVLKADGLAAGKGVVLPTTHEEAEKTLEAMFSGEHFEGAGKDAVVIQERLHGPEISAFALSDGKHVVMLPLSQDHKRLKDNDEGPNTGGMGSYAPVPATVATPDQVKKIEEIARQTIFGMSDDGVPYQGVLYIGLMLAEERGGDPVVIEYNARFGDPEAEILLPALGEAGVDIAEMLLKTAQGDLTGFKLPASLPKMALTVALATAGYPDDPRKGDTIEGLTKKHKDVIVQHAGTKKDGDKFITSGGRVLYVTGLGETPDAAAKAAYKAIGKKGIYFEGMQYRTDIGHQVRSKKEK